MNFLVEIEVRLPGELSDARRAALLEQELQRGRQLRAAGTIERMWRVPGGLRNVGIWRSESCELLHEAIVSLPCFPWLQATVTPLAAHPVEGGLGDV